MDLTRIRNWMEHHSKALQDHVRAHLYFWLTVVLALFVFVGVEQVAHAWIQFPPTIVPKHLLVGYWLFIIGLVSYYLASVFIIVPWSDPTPPAEGTTNKQQKLTGTAAGRSHSAIWLAARFV